MNMIRPMTLVAGLLGVCAFASAQASQPTRADAEKDPIFKAMVGSSRVDLQACKLEYSIVSPK